MLDLFAQLAQFSSCAYDLPIIYVPIHERQWRDDDAISDAYARTNH